MVIAIIDIVGNFIFILPDIEIVLSMKIELYKLQISLEIPIEILLQ